MNADEALTAVREMRQTLSKMERRSKERAVVWPVLELLVEDLCARSGSTPDLLSQLREALDRAAPSPLAEELIEITEDECSADLDSSDDELSDVEEDISEPVLPVDPPAEQAPAELQLAAQQIALEAQQVELAAVQEAEEPAKKKKPAGKVKVERIGDWEVKEQDPEKAAKARAKQLKADRKAAKKKAKQLGDATLRRRASTILTPKVESSERSTVSPGTVEALKRAKSPTFEVNLVLRE